MANFFSSFHRKGLRFFLTAILVIVTAIFVVDLVGNVVLHKYLNTLQDDFEKMVVLKAVLDDQIIGSGRAYVADGTCFVGRVIVHPDFHNRGIGTKLMHKIEGCFKDAKRFELFTGHKTAGALHIYDKLGYREFERKELDTHILIFLEKIVQ